jgi:hypothetical protein
MGSVAIRDATVADSEAIALLITALGYPTTAIDRCRATIHQR